MFNSLSSFNTVEVILTWQWKPLPRCHSHVLAWLQAPCNAECQSLVAGEFSTAHFGRTNRLSLSLSLSPSLCLFCVFDHIDHFSIPWNLRTACFLFLFQLFGREFSNFVSNFKPKLAAKRHGESLALTIWQFFRNAKINQLQVALCIQHHLSRVASVTSVSTWRTLSSNQVTFSGFKSLYLRGRVDRGK